MWNTPGIERLARMPGLYGTENVPLQEKMIHLHFFIGDSDWYVCEFDGDLFFGFAILNGDLEMAEWGYVSLGDLEDLRIGGRLEVDCETEESWRIRPAREVEKIRMACGWGGPNPNHEEALDTESCEARILEREGSVP